MTHDHCPHCEGRTLWQVNILYRFYRCMECGRDPMRYFSSGHGPVPRDPSRPRAAQRTRVQRAAKQPDNTFEEARCRLK